MRRYLFSLTAALLLVLPVLGAQTLESTGEEKGTFLGVLISPVPEVLYDQLPELPHGQGVVVSHVLPESPAARGGLRRHDILLLYNDDKIRDCEHFARLIRADQAENKVKLGLLRGGKRETVEVTLALGPVLRIAQATRGSAKDSVEVPRGTAKGGPPPSVSVAATPLDGGKMRVTIEYYQEGTGRLRTVTCEGTPDEVAQEVQKLPVRVQSLANVALDRIRARFEFQPRDEKVEAPTSRKPAH
jgi:hypothetical protein